MRKTFPKDELGKAKETIGKLKAERKTMLKKIKFLENELINIQKPVRLRKQQKQLTDSEWRKEFSRKFKDSLKR